MYSFEIIQTVKDLRGRSVKNFSSYSNPENVLLCPPTYFDVVDVKNPHMMDHIGHVDQKKAQIQWAALKNQCKLLGRKVFCLNPIEKLEDMIFVANPAFIGRNQEQEKICLISNMKYPSRRKETVAFETWFAKQGYQVRKLQNQNCLFEGHGDALWHVDRRLIWGGYGFRTVPEVYKELSEVFESPVIVLSLCLEHFYHLDTCFCPLSETEVLFYPKAFSQESQKLIRALFPTVIEVCEQEALKGFACNGVVLGKKVLIQQGNDQINLALQEIGYEPIQLDTSEFMKSGGSVFCMKTMIF